MADQQNPPRQRRDVLHVVRGQQHRRAVRPVALPDKRAHRQLAHGVQADGRLVEEQHLRIVQQRRRDLAAHPLAEAQLARRRAQQLAQVEQLGQLLDVLAVARLVHAIDVAQQRERIRHRHVPPELRALAEHHADLGDVPLALLPRHAAVHPADAGVRHEDAAQDLDGRGLARSVGADVADDLAVGNVKGNVVQCPDGLRLAPPERLDGLQKPALAAGNAIGLGEMFYLNHGSLPVVIRSVVSCQAVERTPAPFPRPSRDTSDRLGKPPTSFKLAVNRARKSVKTIIPQTAPPPQSPRIFLTKDDGCRGRCAARP